MTQSLQIFCQPCQQPREIAPDAIHEIVLENGQPAREGLCPVCGAKWLQIVYRNACQ